MVQRVRGRGGGAEEAEGPGEERSDAWLAKGGLRGAGGWRTPG